MPTVPPPKEKMLDDVDLLGEAYRLHHIIYDRWLDRLTMVHLMNVMNLRDLGGIDKKIADFMQRTEAEVRELFETAIEADPDFQENFRPVAHQMIVGLSDIELKMQDEWLEFLRSIRDLGIPRITPLSLEDWSRKSDR